jgi:hypothetical protein
MRILFAMWAIPMGLFWGWYFVSLNNMHFGYVMLSRPLHDLVFEMYGQALGIDPATIPGFIARACIFDCFIVAGIIAFRKRKVIAAKLRSRRERLASPLESRQERYLGEPAPSA